MEVKPGYKQTEVGVIPEEWHLPKLVELIDPTRGVRYGIVQPGKYDALGRYMVRGQDYSDGWVEPSALFRVSQQVEEPFKNARIRAGDILITIVGASTGRIAVTPDWLEGANLTQTTARLAFSPNAADSRYCAFILASWYGSRQVANYIKGGAQPGLNCGDIEKFLIPLPPTTDEQRAIAEALSDVDGLLGGLDRLIAKKRDLKQAAMQQLLTGQTRLPGFHGEWETKRLGNIARCFSGGTPPTEVAAYYDGDIPWIASGDLNKEYITHVEGEISEAGLSNSAAQMIEANTLLIALYGATSGVTAISRIRAAINQAVLAIIPHQDNTTFLYFKLRSLKDWLISTYTQGGQPNLSGEIVKSISFPMPPLPEQIAIAEVLTEMDAELAALEQRREKTRALKQAMMQQLLTGRIRLVSAETKVAAKDGAANAPVCPELIPLPSTPNAAKPAKDHNWQINEAVVISVLAKHFGSEKFPLGRKRYTKLSYLLHRHVERQAEGYLKKAAGPYNPATKYNGPEGIALKNKYIRRHSRDQFTGFVASENIAQAEKYFAEWYGNDVLAWMEQFRVTNDELELLATVDMAMEDLRRENKPVGLETVKQIIHDHPEWEAKLDRKIFSDANITRAIKKCEQLFG